MVEEFEHPLEGDVDDFLGEAEQKSEEIVYSITSFGADFLVDGLITRLDNKDIFIPDFQRGYVWKAPQASRFIESILLGLPIPGIFLYQEADTNKLIIVDGLQRLTTLQAFHSGFLPNSTRRFLLQKVQKKYSEVGFEALGASDRRKFLDTVIHATIIRQNSPKDDQSSIYHIFERLNTGGTPLQPQEVRAALYHGEFLELLKKFNVNRHWRIVYGPESARAKDRELILRFFALLYRRKEYAPPMKTFLNLFAESNRKLGAVSADKMALDFDSTVKFISDTLGATAFRPVRSLNAAVLDSVMVAVAENRLYQSLSSEEFKSRYDNLLLDEAFTTLVSRSTADEQNVGRRIEIAVRYLAK